MISDCFTTVHHFLEKSAERFPEKIAVIHDKNKITYALLNQSANQLANFLTKALMKKGDRVGILMKNSIDYIIAYFATLKVGGIPVALNTENSPDALAYIFNDCQIKLILCQSRNLKKLNAILPQTPLVNWVVFDHEIKPPLPNEINKSTLPEILRHEPDDSPAVNVIDCDLASIVYTSGSTGKPKGVILSHLNLVTNTKSINEYLKLNSEDKILVVLPFHYCYGQSLLLTHFMVGGTVVLDNRFLYPNVVLETMQRERVTGFSGVPSTFYILLNRSSFASRSFPALRYITQAGGAMSPQITRKLIELLPDKKIFIMYGATEASARLSYLAPSDLPQKSGSIGKAIPNVELSIIKENGEKAGVNETGEIVARGSNIMQGYWNDPTETEKVLRNRCYYTGDLAKVDAEGFFYIVGRKKEIIKVGGNRVSAKEIEDVIIQYPDVVEVAVIGIEDSISGEAIKAYIVSKDNGLVTKQKIRLFCSKKIPLFKIPTNYEFVDALPKNSAGKILKGALT